MGAVEGGMGGDGGIWGLIQMSESKNNILNNISKKPISFNEELERLQQKLHHSTFKKETQDYAEAIIHNLTFKSNCIDYRLNRVISKNNKLKQKADDICKRRKKSYSECLKSDFDTDNLSNLLKLKHDVTSYRFRLENNEEIDSSIVFYEFEALLLDLASFLDYLFRLVHIFYPKIKRSKHKIINSLEKEYPSSSILSLFKKNYSEWISEMLQYRDKVAHTFSLNSNAMSKILYDSGSFSFSNCAGHISLKIEEPYFESTLVQIRLPKEPRFKHEIEEKIESGEINYADDFYTLDDYLSKLQTHFIDFRSSSIIILSSMTDDKHND